MEYGCKAWIGTHGNDALSRRHLRAHRVRHADSL